MTDASTAELVSALLVARRIDAALERAYAAAERVMTSDPGVCIEVHAAKVPNLEYVDVKDCLDDLEVRFLIFVDDDGGHEPHELKCGAYMLSAHMRYQLLDRIKDVRLRIEHADEFAKEDRLLDEVFGNATSPS